MATQYVQDLMNMQASLSLPATEDEILALAKKIEERRFLNAQYATAHDQSLNLDDDLHEGYRKLRNETVQIHFWTTEVSRCTDKHDEQSIETIGLPLEAADELIAFITTYCEEKLK